jgi:hypothetical protein
VLYQKGLGIVKNYVEAAGWFHQSAHQGHAGAQNNLAQMYENGQGMVLNHALAAKWYRMAAVQGHADAQNNLAHLYENGLGVAQDHAHAGRWYRMAPDQGHAEAQNTLARLYENGLGLVQDYGEAGHWYRMAASQGHATAQESLILLYVKEHSDHFLKSKNLIQDNDEKTCYAIIPKLARSVLGTDAGINYPAQKQIISEREKLLTEFIQNCESDFQSKFFQHTHLTGSSPNTAGPTRSGYPPYEKRRILPGVGAIIIDNPDQGLLECVSGAGALVIKNYLVATIHSQPNEGADWSIIPSSETELFKKWDAASNWHLDAVNIEAARVKSLTGTNCLLGVLDTGIDASHPEFAGKKIWFAQFDKTGTLISNQPNDVKDHGTHVCGTAAGITCGIAPAADLAVAGVFTKRPEVR